MYQPSNSSRGRTATTNLIQIYTYVAASTLTVQLKGSNVIAELSLANKVFPCRFTIPITRYLPQPNQLLKSLPNCYQVWYLYNIILAAYNEGKRGLPGVMSVLSSVSLEAVSSSIGLSASEWLSVEKMGRTILTDLGDFNTALHIKRVLLSPFSSWQNSNAGYGHCRGADSFIRQFTDCLRGWDFVGCSWMFACSNFILAHQPAQPKPPAPRPTHTFHQTVLST
jgi:hypothetical protein